MIDNKSPTLLINICFNIDENIGTNIDSDIDANIGTNMDSDIDSNIVTSTIILGGSTTYVWEGGIECGWDWNWPLWVLHVGRMGHLRGARS